MLGIKSDINIPKFGPVSTFGPFRNKVRVVGATVVAAALLPIVEAVREWREESSGIP